MTQERITDLMVKLLGDLQDQRSNDAVSIVMYLGPELTREEAVLVVRNMLDGCKGSRAETVLASLTTGMALGRALERGELQ